MELRSVVGRIPAGPVVVLVTVLGLALWSGQPDAARIVPDLKSSTVDQARARADEAGFPTRVVERPGPGAAGTVVAQDPAHGEVAVGGSIVTLEVSQGAPQVVVPQVAGLPVDEARDVLVGAGFVVEEVVYRVYPDREGGRVVGTRPEAGTRLDAGTTIEVHAALP